VDSYTTNADSTAVHFAGGGLDVRALGDIGTANLCGKWIKSLSAGGAFTAARSDGAGPVGSLIALGDARVTVEARTGVLIDQIINPMLLPENGVSAGCGCLLYIWSQSAITLQASAGDINLRATALHAATLLGAKVAGGLGAGIRQNLPRQSDRAFTVPRITLQTAYMFPSADGQLQLLAARDISAQGTLQMLDAPLVAYPRPNIPVARWKLWPDAGPRRYPCIGPQPGVVAAGRDISMTSAYLSRSRSLRAGTSATESAARRNLHPTDLTLISAGRDYVDTAQDRL